jgi:site-specific DNA-methyltransferase (adenine-specific)
MKLGNFELNKIYCMDCLEGLKQLPDKSVDLVVTDPPYGIGADKGVGGFGSSPKTAKKYNDNWDNETPSKEVFDEILRVGKKVFIFGGNFFTDKLPVGRHWIVWDKQGDIKFDNPFSACELVWTNLDKNSIKKIICIQQGFIKDKELNNQRTHPTQKPIKIMRDIIKDHEGQIILDPFMGSGTTAVACKQLGRNFIGFEISQKYVDIANKRLEQEVLF